MPRRIFFRYFLHFYSYFARFSVSRNKFSKPLSMTVRICAYISAVSKQMKAALHGPDRSIEGCFII